MYLCGRWQEKYGPGKLAALGAVLCGSSAIWLSRAEDMTAVYIWAYLAGASSAFIYAGTALSSLKKRKVTRSILPHMIHRKVRNQFVVMDLVGKVLLNILQRKPCSE